MLWYPVKQFGDFSLKFQFRDGRTATAASATAACSSASRTRACRSPAPPTAVPGPGGAATEPARGSRSSAATRSRSTTARRGEPQKTGSIYNFQPLDIAQARPCRGRLERLRDPRRRPAVHDHPQRRGHQPVRQRGPRNVVPRRRPADAGAPVRGGLHRPPEPRRRRPLQYRNVRVRISPTPQRPGAFTVSAATARTRSSSARPTRRQPRGDQVGRLLDRRPRAGEHLRHDRDHRGGEPRQQPDLRQPAAVLAARRGDAGFTSIVVPPADAHGRRAAADAEHHRHGGEPRQVPRPDRDPADDRDEGLLQGPLLRDHDGRRPAGGDFVLTYSDATTQTANVQFRDWCNAGDPTPEHHIAIGPLTHRHTRDRRGRRQCGIYHVP